MSRSAYPTGGARTPRLKMAPDEAIRLCRAERDKRPAAPVVAPRQPTDAEKAQAARRAALSEGRKAKLQPRNREIMAMLAAGATRREVMERFGLGDARIRQIMRGAA